MTSVKILTLDNQAEASLLAALLEQERIPFILKSYHDSAYDGLFQQQLGWGEIDAPAEHAETIRRLYEELRKGRR